MTTWSEEELRDMKKAELLDLAATVEGVDLTLNKEPLLEALLQYDIPKA